MLQDSCSLHEEQILKDILEATLSTPAYPVCWNLLLAPDYPVQNFSINYTVENEILDNKWILYALAPDKVILSRKQMEQFMNGDLWNGRKLTHQLWALIHLRRTSGGDEKINRLIEHLCNRLSRQLKFDIAVVDIYIQKITFILKAGFPGKISRRWVERVIANQKSDGGWDDRWFCFDSGRRPVFGFERPSSHQHATVQALWLLYQVKYRYGDQFGLKKEH
jgi:hypothetical protein